MEGLYLGRGPRGDDRHFFQGGGDKLGPPLITVQAIMMPVPMAPNNPMLQQYLLQAAPFQQQASMVSGRGNPPHSQQQQLPSNQANPANVKIKKLPFYEHHSSLVPPSALVAKGPSRFQEAQFHFM